MSICSRTGAALVASLACTTASCVLDDEPTLASLEEAVTIAPIERLSQRDSGITADAREPQVSTDGRFVLYRGNHSYALSAWLHDRTTGARTVLSLPGDRVQDLRLSADGGTIAMTLNAPGASGGRAQGVYLLDRATGAWTTVYLGLVQAGSLALSDAGGHVAFVTSAALDAALDTNGTWDVYVWDRAKDRLHLASRGFDGALIPTYSRFVGKVFLSADGGQVAYTYEDTTSYRDRALLRDWRSGAIEALFRKPSGEEEPRFSAPPVADMTPDARYFLLEGSARRLVVLDRLTGTSELVERATEGHLPSYRPATGSTQALSDDGRLVVWSTDAINLDPIDIGGNQDVYLHDRWLGTTQWVSPALSGGSAIGDSGQTLALAGGGGLVAFDSTAGDLVPMDTADRDVFARGLEAAPGPTVQLNRWRSSGTTVEYQNAALVTGGDLAVHVDGSRARVTSIAGTASYVGRLGGDATAEVDLTWNGSSYDGFVRYRDPSDEPFDSRTAGVPTALTVTALSDREALIDLRYATHGLRLTVRAEAPFGVLASGWAWAHAATGDYATTTTRSYNPTGWANRVARLAPGQYRVRFTRQGGALGSLIQVAAYGEGSAWCKYQRQEISLAGDLDAYVGCYTARGVPTDTTFVASFVHDRRVTGAPGLAWASYAGTGTALRDGASSSGGAMTLTRTGVGAYTVALAGQTGSPFGVMVTAAGAGNARCNVASFGSASVTVGCWDPATGARVDSGFELAYVVGRSAAGGAGGFAYAGTSSSASYLVSTARAWSSAGGSISAGYTTPGGVPSHFVQFPALSSSRSHAHVTAVSSSDRYCKVVSWYSTGTPTQLRANVRCFDGAGTALRVWFALAYFHR